MLNGDSECVGFQYFCYEHDPSATSSWDEDYGEFGQPKVELKSNVRAGQEITVDYGRHYDYAGNNFQWGSGAREKPQTGGTRENNFRQYFLVSGICGIGKFGKIFL
eukprot:COSAG01_NODE_935_length_12642_cov_37.069361_10_plen_106_part_00